MVRASLRFALGSSLATLAIVAFDACAREPKSTTPAAVPEPVTQPATPSKGAVDARAASDAQSPAAPAAETSPGSEVLAAPEQRVAFPPAPITPPYERSAHDGDGRWHALGDRAKGELSAREPAAVYATVIHPHPASRFLALHVVAMNLAVLDVHLMPGSDDVMGAPGGRDAKARRSVGLIEEAHRDRAVVVFNGGFQRNHGHWGFAVGDWALTPPRPEGCTVAAFDDGSVRVGSWDKLASARTRMLFFRQTPPCLVEDGELHPELVARRERRWGGHDPKRKTRRRSAIGVDESAKILLYGVGLELEPSQLAEAMRLAGARSAAELDINFNWTRFLLIGKVGDPPELRVTSSLLEDMNYGTREYLERPSARDFFYLSIEPAL